jgi:hypothetical protein
MYHMIDIERKVDMSHNSNVLRAAMASVRSQVLDETGIYIEGDKKIIPEMYRDDPMRYVMELHDAIKSLAHNVSVPRTVYYRPWDVAAVLERMFREKAGMSLMSMAESPGNTVTVPVDAYGSTMSVAMGSFDVDFLHGSLRIEGVMDDTYGLVTYLSVTTPLRYKAEAESFLDLVTEEMLTESIYKGKAITYGSIPQFYDLRSIDPAKVIYTDDVMRQLDAEIWSRIRYMEQLAQDGVSYGGAILLHGEYGNGKTLAAGLTAQIAVANGVTYIKGSPGDSPSDLMAMAYLYEPSVVFLEDADQFLSAHDPAEVSRMLDTYDGLDSKGKRVLTVFTTNHVERIHAGMLRPGRLRAVIKITSPDDDARERFIRSHIAPHMVDPNLNMGPINEAMSEYSAAYVVEVIDRSKVYAYSRNGGIQPTHISTDDLVQAAKSLRSQFDLHKNAGEGTPRNRLEDALREALVPHIVHPVNANTNQAIASIPGADDLHAIISHNLKAYLQGATMYDQDGDSIGGMMPSSPFYHSF